MPGYTIYHNFRINASATEVYDGISQPHHLNNWWTLRCTGEPRKGAEYNLYFAPEYNWYGTVEVAIPNQSFHIKMTSADPDWETTTFGFDLYENNQGVNVEFWHKDWPEENDHFKHSAFCWALLLNGLKNYLELGEVVPFEKRA